MLEELDIKNFALIDSAHVDFSRGFTVLSGETGAGKSILIGSLAFLLGGKASMDQIRSGCHEASVTATFLINPVKDEDSDPFAWLDEHGIEPDDSRVILRRIVKDTGKTSSWINGVPVTRADLAAFSEFLVDMHGQHEQQSLLKVSGHRRYLDIYAGITDQVKEFTRTYTELVEKRRIFENLTQNEQELKNRMEMLSFAVQEITGAKFRKDEDRELEEEESRLSSFEKLYSLVDSMTGCFEGDEGSLLSLLRKVRSSSSSASSLDKGLGELDSRLESSFYELEDIHRELRRYQDSLVFDPQRLQEVQERLDLMYRLKKKYLGNAGSSLEELMKYCADAQSELETLGGSADGKDRLQAEIAELERTVYAGAKNLSALRKDSARKMSSDIEAVLSKLGMARAEFSVSLTEKEGNRLEQKCGPYGMDDIEFLICANPGLPMLPLSRIASGGELSRVMLALKTVLSDGDVADTLVFDEIDTGIGGEIARSLGEHMKHLASKKQILCITHLASIAVYADNQLKIQKGVDGDLTSTKVFPVEGEERVREIARMLSGDSTSQSSLEHAASMLSSCGGK